MNSICKRFEGLDLDCRCSQSTFLSCHLDLGGWHRVEKLASGSWGENTMALVVENVSLWTMDLLSVKKRRLSSLLTCPSID